MVYLNTFCYWRIPSCVALSIHTSYIINTCVYDIVSESGHALLCDENPDSMTRSRKFFSQGVTLAMFFLVDERRGFKYDYKRATINGSSSAHQKNAI